MFPTPHTPAERLAIILDSLVGAVAHHGLLRRIAGPLLILLRGRLWRIAQRVTRLAARPGQPPRPRQPRPRAARPQPPLVLPRGKLWLVRLIPETAFAGAQLQHLLAQPDMAAFIADTPQLGRLLRPLCRMLGAVPPPAIARAPSRPPAPPAQAPAVKTAAVKTPAAAAAGTAARAPHAVAKTPPPPRRAPGRRAPAICGPPAPA